MLMPIYTEMSDLFDNVVDGLMRDSFPKNECNYLLDRMVGNVPTDISSEEGGYLFEIDLAGFEKDELEVYMKNGYLTVKASAKNESKDSEKKYYLQERTGKSVSRTYYLGNEIDEDNIKARFDNGVLTLKINKKANCGLTKSVAIEG